MRVLVVALALLLAATAAQASVRMFAFRPPHKVHRSDAHVEAGLQKQLVAELRNAPVGNIESAIRFAVDATGRALHFSLGHKTSMYYGTAARAGNCIEYANLFAAFFDLTAKTLNLPANAYVVHSANARVLGNKVPFRGWKDHDWALVVSKDGRRWFVDPTLADVGMAWDIEKNVDGEVPEPKR